jgi:hypothetical protein
MQNLVINEGNFSAQGNFTGYTATGIRVHIFARQLDKLGWKSDADVKFPFYISAVEKIYGARLDEKGNEVPYADGTTSMKRLTATAVFKTKEEGVTANIADQTYAIEIANGVKQAYDLAGINPSTLQDLVNAAF